MRPAAIRSKNVRLPPIPRLIQLAYAIDAGFALAYLADRFLRHPFGALFSEKFLDLDGERNLPTWYASQKLFVIGALFLAAAWSCRQQRAPGAWLLGVLGAVFLAFSADEFIGLHEQVAFVIDQWLLPGGDRRETAFSHTGIWMLVLVIPALVGLLWAAAALSRLWSDPGVTALLCVGLVVYLGGAVASQVARHPQVVPTESGTSEILRRPVDRGAVRSTMGCHESSLYGHACDRSPTCNTCA